MTADISGLNRLNRFASEVRSVDRALRSVAFAPAPDQDWGERAADVRALSGGDLLNLHEVLPLVDALDAAARWQAREQIQKSLTQLATLEMLCGEREHAVRLLRAAASAAQDPEQRELLEAYADRPDVQVELAVSRHLIARGDGRAADRRLERIRPRGLAEPIKKELGVLMSRPRPIQSKMHLPVLATHNSIGFRLYGRRDDDVDGSYVATQCFCVMFLPIVPLRAFRVSKNSDGSTTFHASVPLSETAIHLRRALFVAILLGALWLWLAK